MGLSNEFTDKNVIFVTCLLLKNEIFFYTNLKVKH